jgi:CheY-like chemotaxis protein
MEASAFGDMRILIADDQKDVGRSLAELVRFCNHQVVGIVASGLDAIQAYARYHPDLVLMDHRMPKLNGATACRNILSKDPAARVILVSAWSPSDDASASGAIAMLPKPVSLEQLNAALNKVAETLPALSPAEMPFPDVSFQPEPIDYPVSDFQSFLPTPNSSPTDEVAVATDFPTPISDFPSQLPTSNFDLPTPIFEITLPVDAPQPHPQQSEKASALDEEKISVKRRSGRRHAPRARVR